MAGDSRVRAQSRRRTVPEGTLLADTNIFVRYLTGAPEEQFRRVRRLFDNRVPLILVDAVVAEIVYVLESVYQKDRAMIADAIRSVVAEPNVHCERKNVLLFATDVYELGAMSWIDAYLVASARVSPPGRVLSFDKDIDRVTKVRVEPT